MQPLRYWSFGRVLLLSGASFFLGVVLVVGWILLRSTLFFESTAGASVGAASIEINAAMLLIPVLPPIALIAAWLAAKLRR